MSDKFGKDLLRRRSEVRCRSEVLVLLTGDPELDVLLTKLGLEELTETLTPDCTKRTYTLLQNVEPNRSYLTRNLAIAATSPAAMHIK